MPILFLSNQIKFLKKCLQLFLLRRIIEAENFGKGMKAVKKKFLTVCLAAGLLAASTGVALADEQVTVTVPAFPVTLNGLTIEQTNNQYPSLVYKDITYVPMTYYDAQLLGLDSQWEAQSGLAIQKTAFVADQITAQQRYVPYKSATANAGSYTALRPSFAITVNGKSIDNSKEEYPLLVFRDVTYFPLTWRFAVDEFGWKYSYDNKNGLVIDAGNVKTSSVTLKDARQPKYREDFFNFAIDGKYLYYEGEKGSVYRRPLAALGDDKQRRMIKRVGYWGNIYPNIEIWEQSGAVYLKHSDFENGHNQCLYRVDHDGVCHEIGCNSYSEYMDCGAFQLQTLGTGRSGPCKGAMELTVNGVQKDLGEANYYYRIHTYHGSFPYYKQQNQIYVLAAPTTYSQYYLYAVNLVTGNMKQLTEEIVCDYVYSDGMIYFLANERRDDIFHCLQDLYALDLATGKKQLLTVIDSDTTINARFAAAKNGLYYRDKEDGSFLFWNRYTGKRETVNSGSQVWNIYNQNGYIVAHFVETPENPYRLMVFAPSGQTMKQVYATADCSDQAVINGLLVYRLEGTNQLVQVQL